MEGHLEAIETYMRALNEQRFHVDAELFSEFEKSVLGKLKWCIETRWDLARKQVESLDMSLVEAVERQENQLQQIAAELLEKRKQVPESLQAEAHSAWIKQDSKPVSQRPATCLKAQQDPQNPIGKRKRADLDTLRSLLEEHQTLMNDLGSSVPFTCTKLSCTIQAAMSGELLHESEFEQVLGSDLHQTNKPQDEPEGKHGDAQMEMQMVESTTQLPKEYQFAKSVARMLRRNGDSIDVAQQPLKRIREHECTMNTSLKSETVSQKTNSDDVTTQQTESIDGQEKTQKKRKKMTPSDGEEENQPLTEMNRPHVSSTIKPLQQLSSNANIALPVTPKSEKKQKNSKTPTNKTPRSALHQEGPRGLRV